MSNVLDDYLTEEQLAVELDKSPRTLIRWLLDTIRTGSAPGKGKPLEHWHATLTQPIPNGTRNSTLAEITGKLLFHEINLILIRDLMLCVNETRCDPPLSLEEVETVVASVARTHLRNNGHE